MFSSVRAALAAAALLALASAFGASPQGAAPAPALDRSQREAAIALCGSDLSTMWLRGQVGEPVAKPGAKGPRSTFPVEIQGRRAAAPESEPYAVVRRCSFDVSPGSQPKLSGS